MIGLKRASPDTAVHLSLALLFVAYLALALSAPAMEMTGLFPPARVTLVRQLGYPLLLLAVVVAIRPLRKPDILLVIPWPLIVLLGWCAFSLTWSVVPDLGLRRLILTACTLAIPFLCIRHFGYDRSLYLLRMTLLVALFLNYAVALLYPAVGTHDFGVSWSRGQWRGFMGHKNIAGQFAAITLILFLFDPRGLRPALRYSAAAAAAVFLALTVSRTSLALVPVALLVGGVLVYFHASIANALTGRHRQTLIAVGVALSLIVVATLLFFTFDQDALLGMAANPTALSNRGYIWERLIRFYGEHPWGGAGFGSFWGMDEKAAAETFHGTRLSEVVQGHNGYLDLLVQVGLPGLLLALAALVVWPVIVLGRVLPTSPSACGLIAAIVIFCLGNNVMESSLFNRDTLGHVFLLIALAMLATARAEQLREWHSARRSRRRRSSRRSGRSSEDAADRSAPLAGSGQ